MNDTHHHFYHHLTANEDVKTSQRTFPKIRYDNFYWEKVLLLYNE